jgi:hypothetical protein
MEIGVPQPAPLFEQTHGHKETPVGKKGAPQPRHGGRIQRREKTLPEEPRTSNPEVSVTHFATRAGAKILK